VAGEPQFNDYTVTLVEGVRANADPIDAAINEASREWTLERMPMVDRAILRLAAFEIAFSDEVPNAVAISEAVQLATDLSTEESPAFINGVLGAISTRAGSL
jgi:N utilization substance protein B